MAPPEFPRVVGIVLAAGAGERLGAGIPKALVEVGGRPLVQWAVLNLRAGGVSDVVVTVAPGEDVGPWAAAVQSSAAPVHLARCGGPTRAESVRDTVRALDGLLGPDPVDIVLVHDAARAFVPPAVVARVIAALRGGAAAVAPAIPVVDSLREVEHDDGERSRPFDRSRLRAVQTPQGFPYPVLLAAHAEAHPDATDDLVVVEAAGFPVTLVAGDERAFKVTRPLDLALARAVAADGVPARHDIANTEVSA